MDFNQTFEDIESQLDNFVIRKKHQSEKSAGKCGPEVHDNVPLTISQILRVTQDADSENVFITDDVHPIHFYTCIVYAFVTGNGTHNESFMKYMIDDGTGSLEASISKNPYNGRIISSLYSEATSLASSATYNSIALSMMRLLQASMEYIDPTRISRGHSLFLRGRPNKYRGKIGLDTFSFCIDSGRSREMEIGFVDYLTDWHQRYKTTQRTTQK
ncbi:uncharacterized protein LOC6545309 [Drosophila erecta]|uniref:Uncharacterized protein n=1 Tax=Drosophila erecta TaxID=7220 RepID=B3NHC0_DROER|nr:uncharacterized protein LOC6545309 [Drosophila erecta]EDV51577.1 uncharacterized protein Dere_GG15580 [Drosophila erecta]